MNDYKATGLAEGFIEAESEEQINEMTMSELFEILAQDE